MVSPLARRMAKSNSLAGNFSILAIAALLGLSGIACRWNHWGIIFVIPLTGTMMALGYMVSYYLNAIVDSGHRATVLSFKGVAFNLGYGFISLVFALVLRAVRQGGSAQDALASGLRFLPVWVGLGAVLCALGFRRHHREFMKVR